MRHQLKEMPLFDELDAMQREAHATHPPLRLVQTGDELKAEGMRQVLKKASKTYKAMLEHALLHFPHGRLITVEDLTFIAGRPPEGTHFNVTGALIAGMAKRGLIEDTGRMVNAKRPGMRATRLSIWRVIKYA